MARIENNSHMLEFTCKVVSLMFFLAILAFSRIKWFTLCLFGTKHGIQHHWVYVIQLKWLHHWVYELFVAFLALSRLKWFKHGLFGTKLRTQYYLVYVIVLKQIELKTIVICLKLRAKFCF